MSHAPLPPSLMEDDVVAGPATMPQMPAGGAGPSDDSMMLFFHDPTSFYDGLQDMLGLPGADNSGGALSGQGFAPMGQAAHFGGESQPTAARGTSRGRKSSSSSSSNANPSNGASASASSNEPGAGPQPTTAFETQGGPLGGGSTLTEFTRRKNWPAKVMEEMCDVLQIVEANGRIRFVSPGVTALLGYTPAEAVGQSLAELVHADDRFVFVSELNACIANASLLRMYYRLRRRDGSYAVVETVGHAHIAAPRFAPNPSNTSPFCQAVFLVSRPYPTKNAALLDSFLEHKMENERLRRRIEDLRHEEASEDRDDESPTQQSPSYHWRRSLDSRSDAAASEVPSTAHSAAGPPNVVFRAGVDAGPPSSMPSVPPMPPPPLPAGPLQLKAGLNNTALTRENLEGIAARQPDSLRDKMARYEGMPAPPPGSAGSGHGSSSRRAVAGGGGGGGGGDDGGGGSGLHGATHADTIEMLTGLRYQEGERSRGLSTGNRSPRLVKGDAGIAFAIDRDQRTGDKKKKMRLAEEYVCTDCGTLESPEWRKGPSGPKTLCNACGLRWAKKEKKERKRGQEAAVAVSPPRHWVE